MVSLTPSFQDFFKVSDVLVVDAENRVYEAGLISVGFTQLEFVSDEPLFSFPCEVRMKFRSSFGEVSLLLEIKEVISEGAFFVFSCFIRASSINEFFIALRDYLIVFEEDLKKKKKEYFCTVQVLRKLRLENELFFEFQHRIFRGIIKSLSDGSISVVLPPDFFQLKRKRFDVVLDFGGSRVVYKFCLVCGVKPVLLGKKIYAQADFSLRDESALRYRLLSLTRTRRR